MKKTISSHPNTGESVIFVDGKVRKISKFGISSKIKAESKFYSYIGRENNFLLEYFPKYLGYFVDGDKNYIELEYLHNYSNLSDVLLKNALDINGCENLVRKNIMETLFKLSNSSDIPVHVDSNGLFEKLFVEKVFQRMKELSFCKIFKNIICLQCLEINGKKHNNLKGLLDFVIGNPIFLKFLKDGQKVSFLHGDYYFGNILINDKIDLKLVDPKGMVFGLASYDFGKLMCSVIGKYDLIQNYSYSIHSDKIGMYKLNIDTDERYDNFCLGLDKVLSDSLGRKEYLQAYFAFWIHYVSLIPHHCKNKNDQALVFYLRAVEIGKDFVDKLNDYFRWERLESKIVFDNKRMKIREDKILIPGNKVSYYTVWDTCKAVAIMALDDKGKLLLKREFRYPIGESIYDLPGGAIEDGESPIDAAKRELFEETGYEAKKLKMIGSFFADPGRANREVFIVLVEGLSREKREKYIENDELIIFEFCSLMFIKKEMTNHNVKDASLICGLSFLLNMV